MQSLQYIYTGQLALTAAMAAALCGVDYLLDLGSLGTQVCVIWDRAAESMWTGGCLITCWHSSGPRDGTEGLSGVPSEGLLNTPRVLGSS